MRIITRRRINDFARKHPDSKNALYIWYKIISKSTYKNFNELRNTFPAADQVDNLTVFNIGGNKYRLITAIHYNRNILYIRHVLTHSEYNNNKWKE